MDAFLVAFFASAIACAAWVAYDLRSHQPEIMPVMKVAWVLITLYSGPVGVTLYLVSCREPRPGTHQQFVAPIWKQAVGSTMHCVAGDALGIVTAAAITSALGFAAGVDFAIEYVAAFLFGWLIFQVAPARMQGQRLGAALRGAFVAELVSLTAMAIGMFATTYWLRGGGPSAPGPETLEFWGAMSVGIAVGFIWTYPVNWLLVTSGRKHGMGTMSVMGKGGHGPAPEATAAQAEAGAPVAAAN
ncbi:MAG: DUF4396 domain-containing protein [Solirubrobacterales bacterium]|nr:DUF4396 domain-containing protein [Solirubrobacterales bacterium]